MYITNNILVCFSDKEITGIIAGFMVGFVIVGLICYAAGIKTGLNIKQREK